MIATSPQTPRLKNKLSLDIPSGYSSNGAESPVSFSSPTFNPYEGSVPPSPTFSGTLYSNRSQAELTVLLKDAYNVIREREKDLTLAAEIGKNLLENNIALKAKYESTIVQLQHLQREKAKATTFSLQASEKHATLIAPPNTSLDNITDDEECDDSDSELNHGVSSSIDTYSPSEEFMTNRKKSHQNSGGLTYKELETLKELEVRNQELQQQYDELMKDYNDCEKSNRSKIRKLEADVQHFQESFAAATQKVEDLEKENDRLTQKQKENFWNLKYSKKSNENDDFIETLLQKVNELEEQNNHVEKTKLEVERRLSRKSNEMEAIKREYDDLIETKKDYEKLQIAHRDQEKLIYELNENLEEQRALVVNYRSGMWSGKTSRANSISDGGSFMSHALSRLSNPERMRDTFGASPKQTDSSGGIGGRIKRTLLSELENEWFREFNIFRDVNKERDELSAPGSPSYSPIASEKDLNDFFISNGARPDDEMMDYLSDDEFSFLDEFDIDSEKANRIREWFWRRWASAIYRFLRMIWRWCRFIIILVAAVIMALYRGPDDVLPNDM